MNDVYALIVIDTDGALASGSAMENAYLVDTNGFLGSWNEGTPALHTVCQDGQVLTWSVAPLRVDVAVSITGFSGAMVGQGICAPAATGPVTSQYWLGRIEARGQFAAFAYTVALLIGAHAMTLNAAVKIV